MKKSFRDQIADKCVHYISPIINDQCNYGVNYRNIAGDPKEGYIARLPCVRNSPLTKQPVRECQACRFPNEEEIDSELQYWLNRIAAMEGK